MLPTTKEGESVASPSAAPENDTLSVGLLRKRTPILSLSSPSMSPAGPVLPGCYGGDGCCARSALGVPAMRLHLTATRAAIFDVSCDTKPLVFLIQFALQPRSIEEQHQIARTLWLTIERTSRLQTLPKSEPHWDNLVVHPSQAHRAPLTSPLRNCVPMPGFISRSVTLHRRRCYWLRLWQECCVFEK